MSQPTFYDVVLFLTRVALALDFIIPVYLQVLLLHPSIPDKYSRPGRALLMIPAAWLGFLAPYRHKVVPVEHSISANFRWAIFGPYFTMRAIEFGLVKDRSIYTWIGFNTETAPPSPVLPKDLNKDQLILGKSASLVAGASAALRHRAGAAADSNGAGAGAGAGASANGLARRLRERVEQEGEVSLTDVIKDAAGSAYRTHSSIDSGMSTPPIEPVGLQENVEHSAGDSGKAAIIKEREYEAEAKAPVPGILSLLSDSFHLLGAMRGIGYACGPPRKSIATPIRGHRNFLIDALKNLVTSHIIATFCLGLILHRKDWVPALLPLPLNLAEPVAEVLGYLAVGISMHAQMVLGFSALSIVFWVVQEGGRRVVPEPFKPSEFDEREWPPLFRRPWEPVNVGTFWGQQWHSLFRTPFTVVGYNPVVKVTSPFVGKHLGRMLGAVAVFALSGWMHDQALITARHPIHPVHLRPLSASERWGGWFFFMWQAAAVIIEGLVIKLFRTKLKGPGARAWSYFCIVGVGCWAGRAWIAQGLVDGLPGMDRWGWQRFVVPTVALAPPPLWCD